MRDVFAEWRAPASGVRRRARLVLQRPLAGRGLGHRRQRRAGPRPRTSTCKRAWAPQAVTLTDEGLDGLAHPRDQRGARAARRPRRARDAARTRRDRIASGHGGGRWPARGASRCTPTRSSAASPTRTNAYRFGPPKHDVVAVRLHRRGQRQRSSPRTSTSPSGLDLPAQREAPDAVWSGCGDGKVAVTVKSDVSFRRSASRATAGSPTTTTSTWRRAARRS